MSSRRLVSILVVFRPSLRIINSYAYTRLNPLESKKQLDSLRVRKTDKIDAEKLANQSYCAVKKTSPVIEEVKYYAGELLRLSEYRQGVLEEMVTLA